MSGSDTGNSRDTQTAATDAEFERRAADGDYEAMVELQRRESTPQVFVQRCRICGHEIQTAWGPDVHSESALAIREHVFTHAQYELVDYAIKEALRGTVGP